jgi:hypothetical protein
VAAALVGSILLIAGSGALAAIGGPRAGKRPDLVVRSLAASPRVAAGSALAVRFSVRNRGRRSAPGTCVAF